MHYKAALSDLEQAESQGDTEVTTEVPLVMLKLAEMEIELGQNSQAQTRVEAALAKCEKIGRMLDLPSHGLNQVFRMGAR